MFTLSGTNDRCPSILSQIVLIVCRGLAQVNGGHIINFASLGNKASIVVSQFRSVFHSSLAKQASSCARGVSTWKIG